MMRIAGLTTATKKEMALHSVILYIVLYREERKSAHYGSVMLRWLYLCGCLASDAVMQLFVCVCLTGHLYDAKYTLWHVYCSLLCVLMNIFWAFLGLYFHRIDEDMKGESRR